MNLLRTYLLAGALFYSLCLPAAALADTVNVAFTPASATQSTLSLTWPENVTATAKSKADEIFLQFDQPLAFADTEAILGQLSGWFGSVQLGYDSLLLTTPFNANFQVEQNSRRVVIRTSRTIGKLNLAASAAKTPPAEPKSEPTPEPESQATSEAAPFPGLLPDRTDARLRMKLAWARLQLQRGETEEALAELEALHSQHPNNTAVLELLAQARLTSGQWRASQDLLEKALVLAPGHESFLSSRAQILKEQGPHASLSHETIRSGSITTERITRLEWAWDFNRDWRLTGNVERNDIDSQTLLNLDSTQNERVDTFAWRGQLGLTHFFDLEDSFSAFVFAAESTFGAGATVRLLDSHGFTELIAEYNKPDWDFTESVVNEGSRDRVAVIRRLRLSDAWQLDLGGGWNHYKLQGGTVATSFDYNAALSYSLFGTRLANTFIGNNWIDDLSFSYLIDGEHPISVDERTDILGGTFTPLGITHRETHTLSISFGSNFDLHWRLAGFAGYSVDRHGGDGPSYGLSLAYDDGQDWDILLFANRSLSSEDTGTTTDQFGLSFRWRF